MNIVIIIEYVINLVLLLIFSMHMFQLNSYFYEKHLRWMKKNIKKVLFQILIVGVSGALLLLNNMVGTIISAVVLLISIIYNMPKGKSKIALKLTSRVKRMFATELIIVATAILVLGFDKYIILKLFILNFVAHFICMIANFINTPVEKAVKQWYINDAKKILKDMPNLTIIGITGSYGKTSVKNFLYKTLSGKYEVLITPKNYNTTMGVVKTIRENLKPTHQIFICEMGATKVGDIKEICDLVHPSIGIITSIGPQHMESFKTIENVIKTKFELADSVKESGGTVFLNYNNEYIAKQKPDMNFKTYGVENNQLDYNGYNLTSSSKGLTFKLLNEDKKEVEFKTTLIGKHNIINIVGAIACANFLGVKTESLVSRVREIQGVEHRLQLLPHGNLTIIDDSYNSNPVSSKSALDTLGEFEGTKIVVTPGLIELGAQEEKYNFELGEYAAGICDYIYLVGENHSKPILEGVKSKGFDESKLFTVSSPQEAMQKIGMLGIDGKITVLLENDLPDNYS